MKVLAIETSCDETAIAIIEAEGLPAAPGTAQAGNEQNARFRVLGNALLSQIEIHKPYGGVFPALAKREHAKNLVPILEAALEEAELLHEDRQAIPEEMRDKIAAILSRKPGLSEAFFEFVAECEPPAIDAIAVTAGPGLEPALWVGINFAKALSLLWNLPLVAVNHMEGHVLAALASSRQEQEAVLKIEDVRLPVLALLISGGHTELVLMKEWLKYELIGQTRDDAVGEAFDKVARMLELPYPGGPEISRLAEFARSNLNASSQGSTLEFTLPRPMMHEASCDFSFAGLKTAVLYLLKARQATSENDDGGMIYHTPLHLSEIEQQHLALEFENAVAEVLWKKTSRALEETRAAMLVVGGGVSANTHIRRVFADSVRSEFPHVTLCIPSADLTTDNAIMIALAGFYRAQKKEFVTDIIANGNLSLIKK